MKRILAIALLLAAFSVGCGSGIGALIDAFDEEERIGWCTVDDGEDELSSCLTSAECDQWANQLDGWVVDYGSECRG